MNNSILINFTITLLLLFFSSALSYESLFPENVTLLQNTRNLSSECLNQFLNLDIATRLLMLDSSTKIPNGILGGTFWDLGNFDECYNIESTIQDEVVYGKYCLGTIPITTFTSLFDRDLKKFSTEFRVRPLHPDLRTLGSNKVGFHWSICVPHKCTAEEISTINSLTEQYCYSKAAVPALTTGAIITIVVLSIFLLLLVCSTIFDVYLYYTDSEPPHELFVAFSALTNGRKLFTSSTNADQLSCLNGIRAISMMWVILGHTYSIAMQAPLFNMFGAYQFEHDQWNMFLLDATVSVDTFFTVGGVVTVYVFLKSMDKGVKFNVILYYLHRYLRLTPAFGICILVYANLLRYLDNGPLWGAIDETLSETCINDWWGSFFYIANYSHKVCLPPSWYLSVDMQLFILSPLVLITLRRFEKIGVSLLGVLCILGVIIPFSIGYGYELNASVTTNNTHDYMIYYYIQTHTRFGPYVIGMLLGYLLYKTKKGEIKISLETIYVYGLWLITVAGLIACLYAPYDTLETYNRVTHSLVLGFQRPAWSLGVCIVIYLCVCGYGGVINKFLSLSIFQLLTKLSYSMYLIHYAIVNLQYFRMKTLKYFSNYDMMFTFWGNFMLTLVLSIFLCLTFESPIIVLEKHIFGRGKAVEKQKKTDP